MIHKKKLFFVVFITNILILRFIGLIRSQLKIEETISVKEENDFLLFAIASVTVIPLVEEIAFRLPLVRNKYYFSSLIGLFLFLFTDYLFLKIGTLFLGVLVIINFLYKNSFIKNSLIVSSILLFSLGHVVNYVAEDIAEANLINLTILFLPQLILGIGVTIIRLRYSFFAAVIYHSLYNLSIFIFYYLVL